MKVATTVLRKGNKILLMKKREYQRYTMPGGKTEEDELPIRAAMREFHEETGLTLEKLQLKVISKVTMGKKVFDMYTFYSEEYSGELIYDNREGVLEWVEIDKIHEIKMYEGDRYVIEHLLNSDSLTTMEFVYDDVRNFVSYSIGSEIDEEA